MRDMISQNKKQLRKRSSYELLDFTYKFAEQMHSHVRIHIYIAHKPTKLQILFHEYKIKS